MKVIAQTAALGEALALAGGIVASRTPKPVLQCVKLSAKDKVLTLLATDLEVGCRYRLTAVQVDEEGDALVPAERLVGIARESAGDDSLTIQSEDEVCNILGAGSKFKIFGFDPEEYPEVEDFTGDGDFQISAATLCDMITKTLFATAKSHSHYAISGVLLEVKGKKIQLVATDGHRLAQAKGTLAKAGNDISAIVPVKLMSMVQRIVSGDEQMLDVKITENRILIRTAQAVLVSSLVQGNFPKYSDVIPKDTDRKATIETSQLDHRVRQAALLTNEESRGIRLSFTNEKITLTGKARETGESEVTCPVNFEGDPVDIAFNPKFLSDALKVAGCEEITIEMSSSSKPAVLKAGGDFLYVLMPVDI